MALIILKELLEEEVIFNQHISDMFSKDRVRTVESLSEIKNLEFDADNAKQKKIIASPVFEEIKAVSPVKIVQ